jgi:hypothetical protein
MHTKCFWVKDKKRAPQQQSFVMLIIKFTCNKYVTGLILFILVIAAS